MNKSEIFPKEIFDQCCTQLVHCRPLVHCMTNDVVQEITADVLLAAGASPAMVIDQHESADFASIADTLLINVGTLTDDRNIAMHSAIDMANLHKKPSVVRGNGSEILSLAGLGQGGHGVDSTDDSREAIEAAKLLANRYNNIVAVTGETDFVTDGMQVFSIPGGDVMTTLVVGTGCSLSALVAAFCACNGSILQATCSALMMAKSASEIAASKANGPGSFHPAYLDALYEIARKHY